jgi:dienelactone hydrolase
VAIVHGFKGFADWGFFPELSQRLAAAGFAALRVNFSHNGTGQGDDSVEFTRLDLFERDRMSYRLFDLMSAIRATRGRYPEVDPDRLALLGHSLGGAVCLLALKSLSVKCLVTVASVDYTRLPADQESVVRDQGRLLIPNARTNQMMPVGLAAVRDLDAHADEYDLDAAASMDEAPWLIAHGTSDETVPVSAARRLAGLAGERARLSLLDGSDHVLGCSHPYAGSTSHLDRFCSESIRFLGERL